MATATKSKDKQEAKGVLDLVPFLNGRAQLPADSPYAELDGVFEDGEANEDMDGVRPRLPGIAVLHDAIEFQMPDGSKAKQFEAVILHQTRCNAFWADPDNTDSPPDCASSNGKAPDSGNDLQNPACDATCPQQKPGSDPKGGKGRACNNRRRLHLLVKGMDMPCRLSLSPTSLKHYDAVAREKHMAARGIKMMAFVVQFSLSPEKDGSRKWAEVHMTLLRNPDGTLRLCGNRAYLLALKRLAEVYEPVFYDQFETAEANAVEQEEPATA